MDLNNLILIFFLIIFNLLFYKYFLLIFKKYNPKLLVDDQFEKPQAFHQTPISVSGGLCIFISLLFVFSYFFLFKNQTWLDYITFSALFFLLGFLDDIKVSIVPKFRLILMAIFLIIIVKFNDFFIYKTGIEILNNWLVTSEIFSLIFICLCFLFIINGANLIDGYNGLLGIHSLIILTNLFLINFLNGHSDLYNLLFLKILIILIFLIFNYPKAKIFLGDGGSYLIGVIIAISAIKTSIANPEISPFYFCILLFYLFFEVFFSFFRKLIKEKIPPLNPDKNHLHMLLYKVLLKKNNNKLKSNYQVSLIINSAYFLLTIPAIFLMEYGIFCKYYSILFFIVYIFSYRIISKKLTVDLTR